MKILIVCRAFDNMAGGVERMASSLANEMAARGHHVHLMTWDRESARSFYTLDPRVLWHKIDIGDPSVRAGWGVRFRRAGRVRAVARDVRPDVVLGFQHGAFIAAFFYCLGLNIPVVAAERNAPSRFDHAAGDGWKPLVLQSFHLAARVIVQCERYRAGYPAALRQKIITIPNPVFLSDVWADPAGQGSGRKVLLSIGRLSFQKNYLALIRAFAALSSEFPLWDLRIAGEGEERKTLEQEVAGIGMGSRISLPGAVSDVDRLYEAAHLFCLPSRWEGFPNVLAEAFMRGLPAVGYAGCDGVNELIIDGRNGALAAGNGDPDTLAQALRHLMADGDARARMGAEGHRMILAYRPDIIYDRWEKLLREVADQ